MSCSEVLFLFRVVIFFSFIHAYRWAFIAVLPVYVFLVLVRGSPFGIYSWSLILIYLIDLASEKEALPY